MGGFCGLDALRRGRGFGADAVSALPCPLRRSGDNTRLWSRGPLEEPLIGGGDVVGVGALVRVHGHVGAGELLLVTGPCALDVVPGVPGGMRLPQCLSEARLLVVEALEAVAAGRLDHGAVGPDLVLHGGGHTLRFIALRLCSRAGTVVMSFHQVSRRMI
jgi:hypothetical protein